MNVRFTQIRLPQATGLTSTDKIPINIRGMATTANFFQTLNTRSEKITRNNNEAEMKRGVPIKIDTNSLKNILLHEYV
ncbi:MAG: hypothetical protein WCI91_03680 [Candidatus Nomurabacteria bacterium]